LLLGDPLAGDINRLLHGAHAAGTPCYRRRAPSSNAPQQHGAQQQM